MPIVDIDSLAIRFRLPRVVVGMLHAIASKTLVILEDNVDGSDATETVSFALDGMSYEIDLSTENAAKLRAALAPYVKAVEAKPAGDREASTPATRNPRRRTTKPVDSAAIRAWAASNGIAVGARGRVPTNIIHQYHQAGN
jgi:Lsr2